MAFFLHDGMQDGDNKLYTWPIAGAMQNKEDVVHVTDTQNSHLDRFNDEIFYIGRVDWDEKRERNEWQLVQY